MLYETIINIRLTVFCRDLAADAWPEKIRTGCLALRIY